MLVPKLKAAVHGAVERFGYEIRRIPPPPPPPQPSTPAPEDPFTADSGSLPGSSGIPMPPLKLRTVVGPLDDAYFDNVDGSFVWGPLDYGSLRPGEAYESVFDFGCGCGRNARQLMLHRESVPQRYLGIDVAPELVAWCTRYLTPVRPSFEFSHHNVYSVTYAPKNDKVRHVAFPAGDGQFSLVNAHSVFTHLYQDQSEYYLREAKRILTDKGLIRCTWFFFNRKYFPVLASTQNCLYINELDPTHAVYYDWDWFCGLVHELGLVIVAVDWTVVPGHQNVVYLGKAGAYEDVTASLVPPKTIVGY